MGGYLSSGRRHRHCLDYWGDFNRVKNEDEKIGRLPVLDSNYEDFDTCITIFDLAEI